MKIKSKLAIKSIFFIISILTFTQFINQSFVLYAGDITSSRKNAITKAVEVCSPAIVGITVTELVQVQSNPFGSPFNDPFFQQFFGGRSPFTQQYEVQGLGSGYIISSDGYIVTNHHVAGNASKVIVTMTNGKKYNAEIIGADLTSDVALLKINGEDFPYLKLGNSDDVIIGEWVIAFGNPFGLFDNNAKPTVTVGVVSNTGVNFQQEGRIYKNMIQTDAAISSGNSGGPLVLATGEVIAMNTVIFSTAQNSRGAGSIGIGFAIPINRVKEIVEILKRDKAINRNFYVGMDVRTINKQISNYLKLNRTEGAVVLGVDRNSISEEAGIEPGDIILEINGTKVKDVDDYNMIINDGFVGQKLKFLLLRDEKEVSKTMVLSQKQTKRR
jgi:serine protease Do